MQQTARIAFQKAGVATSAKQGRRQAVVVRAQNQEVRLGSRERHDPPALGTGAPGYLGPIRRRL